MDTNGGSQEVNYTPADQPVNSPSDAENKPAELVKWDASEFIDHQKSMVWVLPLALIAAVVATITYFLTRNFLSSIVLLMAGVSFGVFAYQKPRTLTYVLRGNSLKVGQKNYSYDEFRTFSIMQEGGLYSIFLEPVRRFMPPLTIYFAPEDGEKIFDILARHIPHQEKMPDAIDRFMQRIRF